LALSIQGLVVAVCLDPEFEALFLVPELLKGALGGGRNRIKGWPTNWDARPKDVVGAAVSAMLEHRPKPAELRAMRRQYDSDPSVGGDGL